MVVEHLRTLVAFPTVSDRPNAPLAHWLADALDHLGLRVELLADPHQDGKVNVLASVGPQGSDGLLLSGHLDVVPTEGQPWTTDPFALTGRDGRWFGRGTADMKGFVAATLAALARLPLHHLERELVLAWTYDEEVGCLGSAHLVETWRAQGRPVPTACLIGEPTDFRILRMHAGHTAIRATIHGAAAHSSRPDLGVNAISGARRALAALDALADALRRELRPGLPEVERPWVTLNVGNIAGGGAVNVVPDRCVIELGLRPLPGDDEAALVARVRDAVRSIGAPWRVEVERLHGISPMLTPAGTSLEGLLRGFAADPAPGAAGYATDGGNLARLGTQPLVFGPGSIDVAHRADEWVGARDLDRAVDVLEAVVRARCL
jgi:acetylornithine deacetylase